MGDYSFCHHVHGLGSVRYDPHRSASQAANINKDGLMTRFNRKWRWTASGLLVALVTGTIGCPGGGLAALVWFDASPRSGPAPLTVTFQGHAVPLSGKEAKFRDPVTPWEPGSEQTPSASPGCAMSPSGSVPVSIAAYQWAFGDNGTGAGRDVTHTYAAVGTYTVTLTVLFSDGSTRSAQGTVTVTGPGTPANAPPVADAGPNQMNGVGDVVQLDGTRSTDADGDPLTYQWLLAGRPDGSTAALSSLTLARPSFTADVPGIFTLQLVVNDGTEASLPDVMTCTAGETANGAPTADAGQARTVLTGTAVTLDGTGSSDPEADPLTFAWSFVSTPQGSGAALSDAAAVDPSFTADMAGTYVAQLVVNDGLLDSAPDTVAIATGTTPNTAPVADAGPDRTAATGATVPLDGNGSSDADGDALTYSWSFLSVPQGSAASFGKSSSASPTFIADVAGLYVVQLIVNDGKLDSEPDTMNVTATETQAERSPPEVGVSPLIYTVAEGKSLNIPVAGTDPDGDVVSLTAAPGLENAAFAATAGTNATGAFSFTPGTGQHGIHVVSFTARDPLGLTDTKHVQVMVTDTNQPPTLSGPDDLTVDEGQLLAIALEASDPDGDVLTLTAEPLPDNALFVPATATITFAPDYNQAGVYDIVCEASDGTLSSGPHTVRVTVNDVTGGTGEPVGLDLLANSLESPSLLKQTRITGAVNASLAPPPPSQITAALITGMNPVSGEQGQTLDVVLTGQPEKAYATHFSDGASTAGFGEGVTVNGIQVTDGNTVTVNVTIDPDASTGARSVTVQTGTETAISMLAFNIVRGRASISGTVVDPDTGVPVAGALVAVEGTNLSTTTDENGQYTLNDVPIGPGVLIINPPDHELIRLAIDPQRGETTDLGEAQTQAVVFDPTAPPAATTLSVVGRGISDTIGEIDLETAKKLIEDAMVLVGGANAGILDDYGNQLNPAITGEGAWSLTALARDRMADRMTRAESYSLQEALYSLSFGMEWTDGPPDLGEWIASLQNDVNQAWLDPTNPENALLVLVFNKGKTVLLDPPELLPETRLNAAQASLLASSIMTYAAGTVKDPESYQLVVKASNTALKQSTKPPDPPIAKAGPDRSGRTGVALGFDGGLSYAWDPEATLTFGWSLLYKPSTSAASLNDNSSATPYFTPDVEGYYKLRLVVSDGKAQSLPDFVNIVIDDGAPVADAGLDRRVAVGETVYLDGVLSEDPGGSPLTFDWSVYSAPSGSTASLLQPDTVNPVFEPDRDGEYIFSLVVNNGSESSEPDYVVITAGNRKPVAYAGLNQVAKVGDVVTLDGTRSQDPDGDTLSYDWLGTTKPAGSAARVMDRLSSVAKFKVDKEGTYVVRLIVRDADSESEPDEIEITTEPPQYFDKYWRNFFLARESKITDAWAGSAYEDEMALHQWATMMPGAGNIAGASMARPMAGESARDLANSIVSNRAVLNVPPPPRIKRGEVITDGDGTRRVEIELDDGDHKLILRNTDSVKYVYRLYRFQGDTQQREEIEEKSFESTDTDFVMKDTEPLLGTHLYAVNVTRYTGAARDDKKDTHSWWPAAFATSVTAFTNGRDRLTSDYSESMAVYAGPGDFAATIDGLEVHPDESLNIVYYSDAETGKFWAIDIETGRRDVFANAGFKQSPRDGRTIVQNGLAIDRNGNLYTDNAASDASFGGRLFTFKQTNGSRENCGVINYYSQLLGFAHPVFSGPMVIRPRGYPAKETLIVAENLSQELRQVDVNEDWPTDRRVGKLYAEIPLGGWGRVIDMEFDDNDFLYVLDGLRVLRFSNNGTSATYVVLDASKSND
jgi:PKD domain/Carboxypeptidase regulatory-like domain/K319L-like, PKD domain/Bacterial Ig domain